MALLLCAIALFLLLLLLKPRKRKGLPPGPYPWPGLGNAFALRKIPYLTLSDWVRIYGDIFKFKLFYQNIVVISDAHLAREALQKPELSGRANNAVFNVYFEGTESGGGYSLVTAEGQNFLDRRKFTMKYLHEIYHNQRLIGLLSDEIQRVVQWCKSNEGKPVDLAPKIMTASANTMWILICGERLITDEASEIEYSKGAAAFLKVFNNPLMVFFPGVSKFFSTWTGWANFREVVSVYHDFLRSPIEQKIRKLGDCSSIVEPLDFVESLLLEIKGFTGPKSTLRDSYKSVQPMVHDILVGGTEAVKMTMQWGILYLVAFPKCQIRLQEEMDAKIGRSASIITLDHKHKLTYAQAVVREVLRKSSGAPLGIARQTTDQVEIGGYTIPKGMVVALNLYHMHHNPTVWGDPEMFRPERFLTIDANGVEVLRNYPELMPFQAGRRQCAGNQIAMDELFLFITNLFKNFNMEFEPGKLPRFEAMGHNLRNANGFNVILTAR